MLAIVLVHFFDDNQHKIVIGVKYIYELIEITMEAIRLYESLFILHKCQLNIDRLDKLIGLSQGKINSNLPSRSEVAAFGIDWKKSDGTPYFTLLHLNVSTSDAMQQWYYWTSGLEANADYFETAKKQLLFALANTRYNLEPIMTFNGEEEQRVGQSWAAHNQRMAQNQANFEAQQRAFVNKSNAINDAIMSNWRERNASSNRNQENYIDGI